MKKIIIRLISHPDEDIFIQNTDMRGVQLGNRIFFGMDYFDVDMFHFSERYKICTHNLGFEKKEE